MNKELLEKHEPLVTEMSKVYLDNMELELGKKYRNHNHQVNAGLTDAQYLELKTKHNIPNNEFSEIYTEFQRMKPSPHLQNVLDAFTASGGNIDIEPVYDEASQRLNVSVNFVIKDKVLDKIEGLSAVEEALLKMNAMLQVETVLTGSDPDTSPSF